MRARVPLEVLSGTVQPFLTFSEIDVAALKALLSEITAVCEPAAIVEVRGRCPRNLEDRRNQIRTTAVVEVNRPLEDVHLDLT